MRRPASLATAALVVMLALTLAPVTRADDRDPRCAGWARHGAPPGTDMAVMCPDTPLGLDGISLGDEPLVPYIVGLLVMAGVLTVFGFVAMRVLATPPSKGRDAE